MLPIQRSLCSSCPWSWASPRLRGRLSRDTRARAISSGTTGGVAWFNASSDCPVRVHPVHGTVLVTLGTASGAASRHRGVSASILRSQFYTYLFDCGEGTDARLRDCSLVGPTAVDRVFITHLHGDHVFGLPGLLLTTLTALTAAREEAGRGAAARGATSSNSSRRVSVYGPLGLEAFLAAAMAGLQPSAARSLPLDVVELLPPGMPVPAAPPRARVGTLRYLAATPAGTYDLVRDSRHAPHDEHTVTAAVLEHTVPCIGYVYERHGKARLRPEALIARGFGGSGPALGRAAAELRAGRAVAAPDGGAAIAPTDALAPGAPPLKVVIMGDNSGAPAMEPLARGADLVLHEATLAPGDEVKAAARRHSTPGMAGAFAARVGARALVLTHFGKALASAWPDACIHALGVDDAAAAATQVAGGGARRGAGAAPALDALSLAGVLECVRVQERGSGGGARLQPSDTGAAATATTTTTTTTVARNVAAATSAAAVAAALLARPPAGATAAASPTLLARYSFPHVDDSPAPSALAAAAASAAASVGRKLPVIAARDWMALPLDSLARG